MKNNRHFTDALFEEFDFFNDEIDNILTEDLDTMLKYYNNLQNWDRQELLNFLTKDPTWNNNKEQGQYSKWVLDKLNRNLLDSSHLGHLYDVLQRFEDNKKHLKNKDINKFRSIQEIDTYLNDDNNYNELSHSQIVRQHRRDKQKVDLGNEAELIYEDSDWEIWIPKTYAASCKLGQGSSWCTASTENSEYFNRYSKKGSLYIILNKYNEKEKYQFHIETDSYMDIDDKRINLVSLIERENTKKWISALRQYNKDFDKQCENILNKAKEAREALNKLLQKNKSTENIRYPSDKWILEEIIPFTNAPQSKYYHKYLTPEDLGKLKNIKFNLIIEHNVKEIKDHEFDYLGEYIKEVNFTDNNNLRLIGNHAFHRCSNIIELELPNSTSKIEKYAFGNCIKLESIILPRNLSSIDNDVFSYCEKLKNVTMPENLKSIGWHTFSHCKSLESIEIPNSVTSIGMSAFWNCKSLREITIPNNLTYIGSAAFSYCTSLANVIFEEGSKLTSIGGFDNCTSLTSITIPNSVTSIGGSAFYNCTSLTNITIPNSVTSIENIAFSGCTSLTNVTIPESVTRLGVSAFSGCPNLVIKTNNPYAIEYCIKNNIKYEKIK